MTISIDDITSNLYLCHFLLHFLTRLKFNSLILNVQVSGSRPALQMRVVQGIQERQNGGFVSMRRETGFSLLELLIVVAIILIIATIAIPSLLRSRQAAQESAAVATLRTINTAEITYLSSNQGSYGDIASLISSGLVDNRFTGSVSGYNFSVTASGSDYTASAMPSSANAGRYGYYSVPDAVIHYSTASTGCGGPGGNCFPSGQSGAPVT